MLQLDRVHAQRVETAGRVPTATSKVRCDGWQPQVKYEGRPEVHEQVGADAAFRA